MKYSININQYAAYKMGLGLDLIDLAILDVVTSMMLSGSASRVIMGNEVYYLVNASDVIKCAPCLGITTERAINNRINKLVDAKLLMRCADNKKLQCCYLALGERLSDYLNQGEEKELGTEIPRSERNDIARNGNSKVAYNNIYNLDNILEENKELDKEIIEREKEKQAKEKAKEKQENEQERKELVHPNTKIEYAKGIRLTAGERAKLVSEYGESEVGDMLEWFSLYKADKGYKNKSDYMAIKRWVAEAFFQHKNRSKRNNPTTGLIDSYKEVFRQLSDKYGGANDI